MTGETIHEHGRLIQTGSARTGKRLLRFLLRFPMSTMSQDHLIDPVTAGHTMPFHRPRVGREFRHHESAAAMAAIDRPLPGLLRLCRRSSFHSLLLL
jgi:hypothetical protein